MDELDNKQILENISKYISKYYKDYYYVNPGWINAVEYVLNEMPGMFTEEKLRKILDDEKRFSFEYFIIKKDIIGILTSLTFDNCFSKSAFHPLYAAIATNDYFIVNMIILGGGHDALLSLSDNTYTEILQSFLIK